MENGSFYSIIPATVMRDKELTAEEKLLYAQITSLTNQRGFCWASNGKLAEIFGVDERTIRRWLKKLRDRNYIIIEVIREEEISNRPFRAIIIADAMANVLLEDLRKRTKELEEKKAKKANRPGHGCPPDPDTDVHPDPDTDVHHNSININNINYINAHARANNTTKNRNQDKKTKFQNFSQREYDFEELEKRLVNRPLETNEGAGG